MAEAAAVAVAESGMATGIDNCLVSAQGGWLDEFEHKEPGAPAREPATLAHTSIDCPVFNLHAMGGGIASQIQIHFLFNFHVHAR